MTNQNPTTPDAPLAPLLAQLRAHSGESLAELCESRPLLLVFLRHAGCAFCRQTLARLAQSRAAIEGRGVRIALVHPSDEQAVAALAARYNLADLPRVADPQRRLYRALELKSGTLRELLSPVVWWRGLRAAILEGHGFGGIQGDIWQLGGAALLDRGRLVQLARHQTPTDQTDFEGLAGCALR